ncbi:hypothetical protein LCGC14_2430520 [marine sediment metagenome]|uniref:Uncharacterized protein n=1 Tax=marine sediment metagenome TaxID=412755 RepID=A0A0F9BM79_9ZZZZ
MQFIKKYMSSILSFNPISRSHESNAYINSLSLALFPFIKSNEIAKIKALLNAGAHLNCLDGNNQTPLHAAARMGNREIVELFLSKGT